MTQAFLALSPEAQALSLVVTSLLVISQLDYEYQLFELVRTTVGFTVGLVLPHTAVSEGVPGLVRALPAAPHVCA
jgi:hypothetical protein